MVPQMDGMDGLFHGWFPLIGYLTDDQWWWLIVVNSDG